MTRTGKCDICRIRKVKCDEQHPKCGQCMKKNRPCRYEDGRLPKFVIKHPRQSTVPNLVLDEEPFSQPFIETHLQEDSCRDATNDNRTILSIRSVKNAKEGNGTFHTFTSIRLSNLETSEIPKWNRKDLDGATASDWIIRPGVTWSPSSPVTSLCARYVSVIGPTPMELNPSFLWGDWVGFVPSRIGINPALDAATECFIEGTIACRSMSESGIAVARKQYSKALRSVQNVLNGPDMKLRLSSETLTAVKLLLVFETMLGYSDNRWVPHCRGLINLLIARGPGADADDMSRSLFYSSLGHDLVEASLNGTDSPFDTPEWLYFAPPNYPCECPAFETAYKAIMQQMIRIPRLMRLLREVRTNPCKVDLELEALQLAEKLYLSNLDSIIEGMVSSYVSWEPTSDSDVATYYPESMAFATVNTFSALMWYCSCRILIIGLCRALKDIVPFSIVLNTAPLATEEMRNASLIAMSVQYAEKQRDPIPTGTLPTIVPLQVSFGAWWRAQREGGLEISECNREWEKEKACFMKEWCFRKSNEMCNAWGGEGKSWSELEVIMSAFEGGPLMNWMRKQVTDS